MMWDDLSQYIIGLAMENSKRTGRNTKLSKSVLEDSKAFQTGCRKMKISK